MLLLFLYTIFLPTTTSANTNSDPFYCSNIKHIHLSSGHDASSSITISFASSTSCLPHYDTHDKPPIHNHEPVGVVAYGVSPTVTEDWKLVIETSKEQDVNWSSRYNASNIHIDQPLYISDPYHHVSIEEGLEPDTTYYYACFATSKAIAQSLVIKEDMEEEEDASRRKRELLGAIIQTEANLGTTITRFLKGNSKEATYSFTTAPPPGPIFYKNNTSSQQQQPITFAFIGDLGRFDHSYRTVRILDERSSNYSAIILAGDIAYTNSYHPRWDEWFETLSKSPNLFLQKTMLQVACGNHDLEQDLHTNEIFKSYEHRFRMPRIEPPILKSPGFQVNVQGDTVSYPLPYEYGNSYYSFVYGPSYHIVLNSYADIRPDSTQYKWLMEELEHRVDRSITPWLIVTAHCPMYNTFRGHRNDEQAVMFRRYLEPIFYQYRVNIFMTGHVHAYMRSLPVYNQQINPRGTVYIIAGTGGYRLNSIARNTTAAEDWVAARNNSTYGYGTLTLVNETHAWWKRVQTGFEQVGKNGIVPEHLVKHFWDEGYIVNQYYL